MPSTTVTAMLRRNDVRLSFRIAHTAYWQVNDEITSRIVAGRMTLSAPDSVWSWNGLRIVSNCSAASTWTPFGRRRPPGC